MKEAAVKMMEMELEEQLVKMREFNDEAAYTRTLKTIGITYGGDGE